MIKKTNINKGLGRGLSSLIADVSTISDTKASSSSGASTSLGYRSAVSYTHLTLPTILLV